jgi:hypothetical protein
LDSHIHRGREIDLKVFNIAGRKDSREHGNGKQQNEFFHKFSLLFLYKIKSAPTEVSAPKNANSNCRQTKLKKHKENSLLLPKWNLRFYQIQKW